MPERLYCGAAKRCITPQAELIGNLRGLGNRKFSGVIADDINVRVIALRTGEHSALIVALELDKVPYPERFLQALERETGVKADSMLLFSTHIHTAPVCGIRPDEKMNSVESREAPLQEAEARYVDFVLERTLDAAREAIASMVPARIGWAEGQSYINVNRIQDYYAAGDGGPEGRITALGANFEGPVDRALWVMRIQTLSGEVIAHFVNYAVHNVAMIWSQSGGGGIPVSSDIGGAVSRMTEEKFGGVCVWSSGAAGDVNPIMLGEFTYPDEYTGLPKTESGVGAETAGLMLRLLSHRHFADVQSVIRGITCTDGKFSGGATGLSRTPGRVCRQMPEGGEEIITEGVPDYEVRETMLVIGGAALCGFSGEMYTTLGWAVKSALTDAHGVVINHNASLMTNAGYIFDDATIARLNTSARPIHVPGYGAQSHILPGYVVNSLPQLTASLYKKITERK